MNRENDFPNMSHVRPNVTEFSNKVVYSLGLAPSSLDVNRTFTWLIELVLSNVHPSIIFRLSGIRSWQQQANQGIPDMPL